MCECLSYNIVSGLFHLLLLVLCLIVLGIEAACDNEKSLTCVLNN